MEMVDFLMKSGDLPKFTIKDIGFNPESIGFQDQNGEFNHWNSLQTLLE